MRPANSGSPLAWTWTLLGGTKAGLLSKVKIIYVDTFTLFPETNAYLHEVEEIYGFKAEVYHAAGLKDQAEFEAKIASGELPKWDYSKAEDVALEASNDLLVRMYYMAVPPFLYADICGALRACRAEALAAAPTDGSPAATWPVERFVQEKPFGRDTASCAALFGQLSMVSEEETFRIDHYLGKELVRAPALDPKAEPRRHAA